MGVGMPVPLASRHSAAIWAHGWPRKTWPRSLHRHRFGPVSSGTDHQQHRTLYWAPQDIEQAERSTEALIRENPEVFDTNRDGILQDSDIVAAKELLLKYDADRDGVLSPADLTTIRQAIRAGIFGRTEYDLKLPEMDSQSQLAAFRRILLGLTTAAILSNMDRVDMAVGIIPISQEMGWDKGSAGMIQSAFFQGFLLSQLPSGLLVNSINARTMLLAGVLTWSAATALAPLAISIAASSPAISHLALPALCAMRFLVGLGQGCVDASIVDTISRWSPTEQRAKSSGLAFNGYNGGMVIGLLLGPWLVSSYGWRALFYVFGALGAVWAAWWAATVMPLPHPDKLPASNTAMALPVQLQRRRQQQQQEEAPEGVWAAIARLPFRSLLSNRVVQGLCICHFAYGWGVFSLTAWLPTYISETLGLSLRSSAFLSLLPSMGGIIVGSLATATSDNLVRRGWDLTVVRRMAQVGFFVLPAACFAGAMLGSGYASLGLIMAGQSFHGLAMAGLWSSHAEVSPKYGALLISITCTCGSIAGALSVACVGHLYKAWGSWNAALVAPLIAIYLLGALAWTNMVVNRPQVFA